MSRRQKYYEAVHNFLQQRRWQPTRIEESIAGATWLELFALFDTQGYRTQSDRLARDDAAQRRARTRVGKRVRLQRSCMVKASMRKELIVFKAAVRYTACNDVAVEHQHLFKAEQRQALRRLHDFAIVGHHPGIHAWCIMSEGELEQVEEAI